MVILPRVDTDHYGAIWMAAFTRADRRIAFSETSTAPKANLNQGTDHLFTDVVQTTRGIHEVESLALLARHMDLDTYDWKPYLWWSKEDHENTDRLLQGVDRSPLVIIAPGASEDRRRWLPSSFGEVGQILESLGFRIVILGSATDIAHGDTILSYLIQPGHLNLAGKLSLMQSAAVMARATAFLGNDSGPLHMAAAVGIPCVEISSFPLQGDPTHHHSPSRFGPWGVKSVVLQPTASLPACQGFCSDKRPHCICQVKVSEVVYAIKQLAQPNKKFVDPS
jgi:ADP-heptose:LPS heptosyltransferase